MAWRTLMRRCPIKSMTIVGDIAQTGDISGSASWSDALGPYVGERWRLAPLTVNYRTPAEIMTVAADVLAEIDPAARPPASVRESGVLPWRLAAAEKDFTASVTEAAATLAADHAGSGTLAVLCPADRLEALRAAVTAVVKPGPSAAAGDSAGTDDDGRASGPDDNDLERPVVVLTVREAKGLEFDSVLVADPAKIITESVHGLGDLYVALTRATQRVGVIYTGELPSVLIRLTEIATSAEAIAPATGESAPAA